MKRWFIKYRGKLSNVSFTSKAKAEEYATVSLEIALDAACGWAKGTHYQKNYDKDIEDVFHMEIECYRLEKT